MEPWPHYLTAVSTGLEELAITDRSGTSLTSEVGFRRWLDLTRAVDTSGGSVYVIGNGASAAMASHIAADACKNGGLRARAFTNQSLSTAIGNDLAFDEIFALPLTRFARPGDLLISISSSGRSPNIVRALEQARTLQLHVVTLSGKEPDNPSRRAGDVNFYIPRGRYGWIECAHHVVLHYWLDQYMNTYGHGAA